jgi:hypothetical protein
MKITRISTITGIEHSRDLPITEEQLKAHEQGALLQDAFPDLAPPLREFIKSGITPEEWNAHVVGGKGGVTGEDDERWYILAQLLELFAICREQNINLSDLFREAERIADPERG